MRKTLMKEIALDRYSEAAKQIFGTTENWREGGIILRDGSIIKMPSGKHKIRYAHAKTIAIIFASFGEPHETGDEKIFLIETRSILYAIDMNYIIVSALPDDLQMDSLLHVAKEMIRYHKKTNLTLLTLGIQRSKRDDEHLHVGINELPHLRYIIEDYYSGHLGGRFFLMHIEENPSFEVYPDLERIVDTESGDGQENGLGWIENGVVTLYHVTDEPEKLLARLRREADLLSGLRRARKIF